MSADATLLRNALQLWQHQVFETAATDLMEAIPVPVLTRETVDSGRTEITAESDGFVAGVIAFETPQAAWSNDGTRPHRIEGNPLLSFYWPAAGRRVVLRYVNHPGNKPGQWLEAGVTDQKWADTLNAAMGRTPLG